MTLTDHIEQDIISHLNEGRIPCRLTVAALAAHYNVSSTPVRKVISKLLSTDKIIKMPNGRLEAVFEKTSPVNIKTVSGNTDPYELILREIVVESLKSEEIFLREESTASKHGLSRSVVREICHVIAGQGLLEHIPRRGWRIRPFSQGDLHNYSQIREVMELKALDLAWGKLLDIDLQSMLDGNIRPDSTNPFPVIDNRLHGYIIEKADNFYIKDFFKRHAPFFKILFEWEGEDHKTAGETVEQHHNILNALLNRDKKKAAEALSFHIHHNHPVLENLDRSKGAL